MQCIDPTIKLDHAGKVGAFIECLTDQTPINP